MMWWRRLRAPKRGKPFDCAVPELDEGQDRPRHHIIFLPSALISH
jgi:hypothetical protein